MMLGCDGLPDVEVLIPPRILQRNNASCMYKAIDTACQAVSLAQMKFWATQVIWLCQIFVKDAYAANHSLCNMLVKDEPPNACHVEVNFSIHAMFGCLRYVLGYGNHLSAMFSISNLLSMHEYVLQVVAAESE